MFTMNDDLSISATRGDIVFFSVTADDNGILYKFQPGDIVRMAIYGKKDAETCVMQKDFPVTEVTEKVFIFLDEEDTKIGDIISKHKDYWYEVVLNPDTMPQTLIGYDEDGAKVFRLFPESNEIDDNYDPKEEDFPVVDSELDMTSPRPVSNSAIARAVATMLDTCKRTNEAVAELHVTPQMFGAIGDGVADDTEAIQSAVAKGGTVFFPEGTYLVSETIVIPEYVHLEGVGKSESVIKYTGSDFLFDVRTSYTNNAVIENLCFNGGAASFLKCSSGKWGAKVIVRNARVEGFSKEVFHFESCFNPIVENCNILSDGKIVFTTFDGTITETNFTNCAQFHNVYMNSYSGSRTPVMFELTNVREISFHKCQLETTNLILNEINKTTVVSLYNCWFENIGAIYRKGTDCSEPSVDNCNFVRVSAYNADATTIDSVSGRKILLQVVSGKQGLKALAENSISLDEVNIYNPNDGYSQYTPAYRIATDGTDFNQPLNKRTVRKFSSSFVAYNLNSIIRYSGLDCVFNVLARIVYNDDSSKVIETKVICLYGNFFACDINTLKLTKWEGAVSSTAKETITCNGGDLKLESSVSMKRCDLMIDFNFNHA